MPVDSNKIIIAGGSGLIGSELSALLEQRGYDVFILTRQHELTSESKYIHWSPKTNEIDLDAIADAYAVINLAGAGVMDKRWSTDYKKILIDSRTQANACLKSAFKKIGRIPLLMSASAIGFYGQDMGRQKEYTESDEGHTEDFLRQVTQEWERTAREAGAYAERHIIVRIGIVLSMKGGALTEMLKGFQLGLCTYFSPGDQIYSWIHIQDLCRIFLHLLDNHACQGVFNGVSPEPVSARSFADRIGAHKYSNHLCVPIPLMAAKLILGERHEVLTTGNRVSSRKIASTGFSFSYPTLDACLTDLL